MEYPPTVYALINTVTGRIYVGRTCRPIKWREQEHRSRLKYRRHTNIGLQTDFDKYGDCFALKILEVESGTDSKEKYWMEKLKTYDERYGYNNLDAAAKKLRKSAGLYVKPSPLKGIPRSF